MNELVSKCVHVESM